MNTRKQPLRCIPKGGCCSSVGAPGFEPGASCTPCKRASQTAPRPVVVRWVNVSVNRGDVKIRFVLVLCGVGRFRKQKIRRKQGLLGDDLLSQGTAPPVPSARVGLTTGFEKGPGGPPPP